MQQLLQYLLHLHLLHCDRHHVKYLFMKPSSSKPSSPGATNVRENSVGWMIKSLAGGLDKEMSEALKHHKLNLGQFAILMTLLEGDGITQSEIGKRISMPGYATTRNIDELEKNGFLERQINKASRRSFCIRLTNEGRALAPALFSIVKKINKKALSPLEENEVEMLKTLLKKMLSGRTRSS